MKVTDGFPYKGPVARSFDIFFVVCLDMLCWTKQSIGWRFETHWGSNYVVVTFTRNDLCRSNNCSHKDSFLIYSTTFNIICINLIPHVNILLFSLFPNLRCRRRFTQWFHNSMMTSSNGNIFRVTGHLCGEFTGPRWIPRTKASDAELWCFLWSVPV